MAIATQERLTDAPIDFASNEVSGQVADVRELADGFWKINLVDGRVAVGVFEDGEIIPGASYRFFGTWHAHQQHGDQFRAESHVLDGGQTEAGTIAYLHRSNLGLSRSEAVRLWKHYGSIAIATLRTAPEWVAADGHLPPEKANRASAILAARQADEPARIELFTMFAGRGIPRGTIKDCLRKWGRHAPAIVRRDPFRMLTNGISGVGFKRCDQLFLEFGHPAHRLKRQTLGAWYWLRTNGNGNTWEAINGVEGAILKAAGGILTARFADAIELGVRARWLARREVAGQVYLADRGAAWSEDRLAKNVKRILSHKPAWPDIVGLPVSVHQAEKLSPIISSPLAILGGTPGTGKTFVAAALLQRLVERIGQGEIAVCAPTGKAAVRITEAMEKYNLPLKATTIHSLLVPANQDGDRWQFEYDERNRLPHRVVVVDESSMVDTDLASSLFAAIGPGASVLLVGDPYQLPPVGHGAPLRDLIAASVPAAVLTELQRNSGDIVSACRDIKDGASFRGTIGPISENDGRNLKMIDLADRKQQLGAVIDILRASTTKGYDAVWDVQVLVGTNTAGGELSRVQLNVTLQDVLNPIGDRTTYPHGFRTGDKVICLKNSSKLRVVEPAVDDPIAVDDYQAAPSSGVFVSNGDMGRVLAVNASKIVVEFMAPSRIVQIDAGKRKPKSEDGDESKADLDLAYAITTHKSQGSEWPVVVVAYDQTTLGVGCREWIYTAISRAKRLCFTVGPAFIAARMVARSELGRRRTFLADLIKQELS